MIAGGNHCLIEEDAPRQRSARASAATHCLHARFAPVKPAEPSERSNATTRRRLVRFTAINADHVRQPVRQGRHELRQRRWRQCADPVRHRGEDAEETGL